MVGYYNDADFKSHGFVYADGMYTTIDDPNSKGDTELKSINNDGQIFGQYGQIGFDPTFLATPVCFCAGTSIATSDGVGVPVEHLAIGDVVVTAAGARRAVRWLGHRTIDCRRHPRREEVMPVRIAAHAFGFGRPVRDLYVSPGHAICVDVGGEVLIPASALVDGAAIAQVAVESVTYWHVELDDHDVILADGLPCESYLDRGNRGFFAESGVIGLCAAPDAVVDPPGEFCRPFYQAGPVVEAVRSRLGRTRPACSRPPFVGRSAD